MRATRSSNEAYASRTATRVCAAILAALAASPALSQTTRTINLINECDETIWAAAVGLPAGEPAGFAMPQAPPSCSQPSECPSGEICEPRLHKCTLSISVPSMFSGRFWARTGCTFSGPNDACPVDPNTKVSPNCCSTGGCTVGKGPSFGLDCTGAGQAPTTLAEFTLQKSPQLDFYDVSMVDGFNVPIEITPAGTFSSCPPGSDCSFRCTNPGCVAGKCNRALAPCEWDRTLGTNCAGDIGLRAVDTVTCTDDDQCSAAVPGSMCRTAPGGVGQCVRMCDSDADCDNEQLCGNGNNQIIGFKICGKFAGCTSGKDLCGIGQYFEHKPGGATCTSGAEWCSGERRDNQCTPCPADFLCCGEEHR
jgi:hypothetical protein